MKLHKIKNLKIISINKISANKKDENKKSVEIISNDLFKKVFNIKSTSSPEIFNVKNKYYLAEVSKVEKRIKSLNDQRFKKL